MSSHLIDDQFILLCAGPSISVTDWSWLDATEIAVSTAIRCVPDVGIWAFRDRPWSGRNFGMEGTNALWNEKILKITTYRHESEVRDLGIPNCIVAARFPRKEPINHGSLPFITWFLCEMGCKRLFYVGVNGDDNYAHTPSSQISRNDRIARRSFNDKVNKTTIPYIVSKHPEVDFRWLGERSALSHCMKKADPIH